MPNMIEPAMPTRVHLKHFAWSPLFHAVRCFRGQDGRVMYDLAIAGALPARARQHGP